MSMEIPHKANSNTGWNQEGEAGLDPNEGGFYMGSFAAANLGAFACILEIRTRQYSVFLLLSAVEWTIQVYCACVTGGVLHRTRSKDILRYDCKRTLLRRQWISKFGALISRSNSMHE